MERNSYRNIQNLMLFITIAVLASAFYIEKINNLEPCPLCIMQRLCTFILGFGCFVAFGLASLQRARMISVVQIVTAVLGIYFASRQLWLQSLPTADGQMCMPGLEAVMSHVSFGNLIKTFLWGSASCSDVSWSVFGLTMPAWALMYFIVIAVINIGLFGSLQVKLQKLGKSS